MTAAMAMPGNTADTFLVHFFGDGLADERYVVEPFSSGPRRRSSPLSWTRPSTTSWPI